MAKTYTLHVAGLTRELPICKINDHLDIAAFIMFSDVELTIACAKALLEKCPDFDVILTSLPLTLLFSILHALLCILPCLFIGNRLHRKLVTDQNVIPPRIQLLLFLEVTICSCIFLINIIFGSLLHYPSDILAGWSVSVVWVILVALITSHLKYTPKPTGKS